ncbi:polyamine-transporting ATPase 13A3-like [Lineus longissimus]|uniref:polyamine-transporting ATPase 13A3-like n=1 Tax=Lineus longissimus TaxID=88925 RepID=UPI002B4E5AF9
MESRDEESGVSLLAGGSRKGHVKMKLKPETADRNGTVKPIGGVVIEEDKENHMKIYGYHKDLAKEILFYLLIILTGGIALIVFTWKRELALKCSNKQCPVDVAPKILVKNSHKQSFVETVKTLKYKHEGETTDIKYFTNKKISYLWDEKRKSFSKLRPLQPDTTCQSLYLQSAGLDANEADNRRVLYGENLINIEVKPVWYMVLHESMNPYYIFQIYSVAVWLAQQYILYSVALIFMSALAIGINVYQTRKQTFALRTMMVSKRPVTVCRNNTPELTSSEHLVPGDVIIIPSTRTIMECDAVLLTGSCVVDESMLTGESIPITKTPLPTVQDIYSADTHKRHTLFCGTKVIQTHSHGNEDAKAVVVGTGFSTAKGELVRSILFPKPVDMKMYADGMKIMVISLSLGVIGMIYTGVRMSANEVTVFNVIINVLDILTFTVPPSLPAVMTLGNVYAQGRLKRNKIFCLNSKYINIAGTLDLVCFDKTGTLTNDGLDLWGIRRAYKKKFSLVLKDGRQLLHEPLLVAMATCHSLAKFDGKLAGYPLDLKMFEAIGWEFEDDALVSDDVIVSVSPAKTSKDGPRVGIVRQLPFSSSLQRMSVIAQYLDGGDGGYIVFTKGSPEKIAGMCRPNTVPSDFNEVLSNYTSDGFRVIAMAYRPLPKSVTKETVQTIHRNDLEADLTFLGLLVMENALKPQTEAALRVLHNANIRTVMVTGDNILTAIKIGRDCRMINDDDEVIRVSADNLHDNDDDVTITYKIAEPWIKSYSFKIIENCNGLQEYDFEACSQGNYSQRVKFHFALDGATFEWIRTHDPNLLIKIVQQGTIFARMLPEQKVHLIEELQKLDYTVGMCGDGANDCGALKCAHAGISLSVAEASVASPFTSKEPNIECVQRLIREGRCAVVTCFGVFKLLLGYFWECFFATCILYFISSDLTDEQYLWTDLALVILPIMSFPNTGAYEGLVARQPPQILFTLTPMLSLLSYTFIQVCSFTLLWTWLHWQPWFVPWDPESDDVISHENTLIMNALSMAFIAALMAFPQGAPYRQNMFQNKIYSLTVGIMFVIVASIAIYPPWFVIKFLKLKLFPSLYFQVLVFLVSLATLLLTVVWEIYFVEGILWEYLIPKFTTIFSSGKKKHKQVEETLTKLKNWPSRNLISSLNLKSNETSERLTS